MGFPGHGSPGTTRDPFKGSQVVPNEIKAIQNSNKPKNTKPSKFQRTKQDQRPKHRQKTQQISKTQTGSKTQT
jgi:hypothetical protein